MHRSYAAAGMARRAIQVELSLSPPRSSAWVCAILPLCPACALCSGGSARVKGVRAYDAWRGGVANGNRQYAHPGLEGLL